MKIGFKIKELRKRIDLSQEKLGEKIGKSKQWVSRVETDNLTPDIDTVFQLAEVLQCDVMDILPSGRDVCDDPTDFDTAMMLRQNEIKRDQQTIQSSAVVFPEPEGLIKKRESIKTIIDVMDEDQLDTVLRFIVSSMK